MLELRGVALDDLDTAFDSEFLMEQMELRERLGAVKECADPHQKLQKIADDISARKKEITGTLAVFFIENTSEALEKARDLTRRLQFFSRLEEEVNALDDDLSDY